MRLSTSTSLKFQTRHLPKTLSLPYCLQGVSENCRIATCTITKNRSTPHVTQIRFVVCSKDLYERDAFWKRKISEISIKGGENVFRASNVINKRPCYVVECNLKSGYPEIVLKSVNLYSKCLPKSSSKHYVLLEEKAFHVLLSISEKMWKSVQFTIWGWRSLLQVPRALTTYRTGIVLGNPWCYSLAALGKSQLVCHPPVGNLNSVVFFNFYYYLFYCP